MVELKERIYKPDGTFTDHQKQFSSKESLLKILKRSPMPTETIYALKKNDEAHLVVNGEKRRLLIVKWEPDAP